MDVTDAAQVFGLIERERDLERFRSKMPQSALRLYIEQVKTQTMCWELVEMYTPKGTAVGSGGWWSRGPLPRELPMPPRRWLV